MFWRTLVPVLAAINCTPSADRTAEREQADTAPLPMALGLVTGAIYQSNSQPDAPLGAAVSQALDQYSSRIMCEYEELGVKWIRIEANWPNVSTQTYQTIVKAAHARHIKVLVVVPTYFCPPPVDSPPKSSKTPLDQYIALYQAKLNNLTSSVFTDDAGAHVDAFEIGNEPNVANASQCATKHNAMAPADFVKLLRGVWSWKKNRKLTRDSQNKPTELIVSGALVNSYTNESYWSALLDELDSQTEKPFDKFGVHPYDTGKYHESPCAIPGAATGFACWSAHVTQDLQAIKNRVHQPLFVTEFGWQDTPPCTPTDTDSKDGCVPDDLTQANGLGFAVQALQASGVVEAAFWYDYRDNQGLAGGFGLRRGVLNTATAPQVYPAKPAWTTFYDVAHPGTAVPAPDPDQCWQDSCQPRPPGPGVVCCDSHNTTGCEQPGTSREQCGFFQVVRYCDTPPDYACSVTVCGVIGQSCNEDYNCAVDGQGKCNPAGTTPKTPACGANQPPGTFGCTSANCGNAICDSGDNAASCPADCPWQDGDGVCSPGETGDDCYFCSGS